MLWEHSQYNPSSPAVAGGAALVDLAVDFDGDDAPDVASLANGLVQLRSSAGGAKLFAANLTDAVETTQWEGTAFHALAYDAADHLLHVAGVSDDGMALVVFALNVLDEKATPTPRVLASAAPLGGLCALVATPAGLVAAALTRDGAQLATAPLRGRKAAALTLSATAPWLGSAAASVRTRLRVRHRVQGGEVARGRGRINEPAWEGELGSGLRRYSTRAENCCISNTATLRHN
jgi:hypothetical protein